MGSFPPQSIKERTGVQDKLTFEIVDEFFQTVSGLNFDIYMVST